MKLPDKPESISAFMVWLTLGVAKRATGKVSGSWWLGSGLDWLGLTQLAPMVMEALHFLYSKPRVVYMGRSKQNVQRSHNINYGSILPGLNMVMLPGFAWTLAWWKERRDTTASIVMVGWAILTAL